MHYRTNLSPKYEGKSGYGVYADGMMEMDAMVGELLSSTSSVSRATPWRCVEQLARRRQPAVPGKEGVGGFEGGFRVPVVVKWRGRIPAVLTSGEFMTMEGWLPTILSMIGQPNVKDVRDESEDPAG